LNGLLVGFTTPVPLAPAVPATVPLRFTVGYGALFSSAAEMAWATHCVCVGIAVRELSVTLILLIGDADAEGPLRAGGMVEFVTLGEEGRKKR